MIVDLDETFEDFALRCPQAATRIRENVKEDRKQGLLQEAKRLKKPHLTENDLEKYDKKQLSELVLKKQYFEVKKKLSEWPKEVSDVLLEEATGASGLLDPARIDNLISIYHNLHPSEPVGIAARPDTMDTELFAILDRRENVVNKKQIDEAFE